MSATQRPRESDRIAPPGDERAPVPAEIVHFLALPSGEAPPGTRVDLELTKAAPYFRPLDTEVIELGTEPRDVGGEQVAVTRQLFDGEVLVIEARWTVADLLDARTAERRIRVQDALRALAGIDTIGESVYEEYATACVTLQSSPSEFVTEHRHALAPVLRRDADEISEREEARIFSSQVNFTDEDLAVVDFDGALLIDSAGQFSSDLALLKLGTAQLVRYRALNDRIDDQLAELREGLSRNRPLAAQRRMLRSILETRLQLSVDYETVDQLLLLIGDWYTADLYRIIVEELYIDEWKSTVRAKLDELHTIADSASANLAVSWEQLLDLAQLIGWGLLLVGYFVLFALELSRS